MIKSEIVNKELLFCIFIKKSASSFEISIVFPHLIFNSQKPSSFLNLILLGTDILAPLFIK